MPLVLYSFVLLMGFFLSGALEIWVEADETRLMNLPLGSYVLFAGAGLLTYHLHRMDSLPISRRILFRILTLPTLVVFCLGWATVFETQVSEAISDAGASGSFTRELGSTDSAVINLARSSAESEEFAYCPHAR